MDGIAVRDDSSSSLGSGTVWKIRQNVCAKHEDQRIFTGKCAMVGKYLRHFQVICFVENVVEAILEADGIICVGHLIVRRCHVVWLIQADIGNSLLLICEKCIGILTNK